MLEKTLSDGLQSKDRKWGLIATIVIIVALVIGIVFLSINNGNKSDEILDLQAQLKIESGYSKRIQNDGDFLINEALRVSGSKKILEALLKEDPEAFTKLQKKWKDSQPVTYKKIVIDRPGVDTLIVSKAIINSDTIIVEFNWNNRSMSINGVTYVIPDTLTKTFTSFTKLNVIQDPLKFIITVFEGKDGTLKTAISCSDPEFIFGEIDTRLAKNFTLKRDIYFMLGGSLGTSFYDLTPKISVYTGLDFIKNNWGIFLRLDVLEQNKIFQAASVGFMKKF
jgi:hypothetical protein